MKEKIAKAIRIVTVPPVIVSILILILVKVKPEMFRSIWEPFFSVLCLGIVPALAYPVQPLIPALKKDRREGQRTLAFIFTAAGYAVAFAVGYAVHVDRMLQFLYNGYFLSVLVLVFFNKILHIRASGHATSITGPLIFLIFFTGPYALLPCILTEVLVFWSSLYLKRHKLTDLALGALVCLLAFAAAYLIYKVSP